MFDADAFAGAAAQMAGDNQDLVQLAACCKEPQSLPDLIKAAEQNATILDKKGAEVPVAV
jgi:hypothetical protein